MKIAGYLLIAASAALFVLNLIFAMQGSVLNGACLVVNVFTMGLGAHMVQEAY